MYSGTYYSMQLASVQEFVGQHVHAHYQTSAVLWNVCMYLHVALCLPIQCITRIMMEHWSGRASMKRWRKREERKKGWREKGKKRRRCFTGNRTQDLSHGKSKLQLLIAPGSCVACTYYRGGGSTARLGGRELTLLCGLNQYTLLQNRDNSGLLGTPLYCSPKLGGRCPPNAQVGGAAAPPAPPVEPPLYYTDDICHESRLSWTESGFTCCARSVN